MSTKNKINLSLALDDKQSNFFISPEQYGLPGSIAEQKLSPLDMNMPRLYGIRWILCFPLESSASKAQMYDMLNL
jgi:hypothetical protein